MAIYKIQEETIKGTHRLLFAKNQYACINKEWVRVSVEKQNQEFIELWVELKNEGAHPYMNPQILPRAMIAVEQDRLQAAVELLILYSEKVFREKLNTHLLHSYRAEIAKEVTIYLKKLKA